MRRGDALESGQSLHAALGLYGLCGFGFKTVDKGLQMFDLCLLFDVGGLLLRQTLGTFRLVEIVITAVLGQFCCDSSMVCVVVAFKKSRSWEMMICVQGREARWFSSHNTVSKSKWLVGSSKSSKSARQISAWARLRRIRQPPEKDLTGRVCSS